MRHSRLSAALMTGVMVTALAPAAWADVAEGDATPPAAPIQVAPPTERPLAWVVAPFDNEPNQPMMFLGFAKVKANENVVDRILRLAGGVGLLYLAIANPVNMPVGGQWGVGVAGGILTLTGADGYCPLYDLFGIRTR